VDGKGNENCAVEQQGGFWFKNCANVFGTGPYSTSPTCPASKACIYWQYFGDSQFDNLKTFEMKFR
jgi:hypothetical protein